MDWHTPIAEVDKLSELMETSRKAFKRLFNSSIQAYKARPEQDNFMNTKPQDISSETE